MSCPFTRWENNQELLQVYNAFLDLWREYTKRAASDDTSDHIEARKLWQKIGDVYWQLVWSLVSAQIEEEPEQLFFDEVERAFIDYGILPDLFEESPSFSEEEAPVGLFQYFHMTDYFNELYSLVFQKDYAGPLKGPSLEERQGQMEHQLESLKKRLHLLLQVIFDMGLSSPELNITSLLSSLEKNLELYTEVHYRTRKYRESSDDERQVMASGHYAYNEAEKMMLRLLKDTYTASDSPLSEEELSRVLHLHQQTQYIAMSLCYFEMEKEKWRQKKERFQEKYEKETPPFLKREIRNILAVKQEYISLTAKSARLDKTPLLSRGRHMQPLSLKQIASQIEGMVSRDLDLLRVSRIRMYGLPTVIMVPGQGYGTYDWSDNTFLIPLASAHSHEKNVAYALGTFRWDSDEDRAIKNSYELIKENRKKSVISLSQSFYKDYYTWIVKECKGYRVLPRETHKVFKQIFPTVEKWKIC
ncbi:hypothetical protein [Aminobacterium mobile]